MNEPPSSESERQFAHFGFTSSQLYEDFRDLTLQEVTNVTNNFGDLLNEKIPEDLKSEIPGAVEKLKQVIMVKAEEPLQKFKAAADEIFKIPPAIEFEPDEGEEAVTTLRQEVVELEKKYVQERHYQAKLKLEMQKFHHYRPLFEICDKVLEGYKKRKWPNEGEPSLGELFETLRSKLEEYHSLPGPANDDSSLFNKLNEMYPPSDTESV